MYSYESIPLSLPNPLALQPPVFRIEGFPSVLSTGASQSFRSQDGVWNRRGRVLGGGSAVNAGFYRSASREATGERVVGGYNKPNY